MQWHWAPENSPEERSTCNQTVSTRRKVKKQAAQVPRQTTTKKSTGGLGQQQKVHRRTGRMWQTHILHLGENMPTRTWVSAWDNASSREMMEKLRRQNDALFYLGGLQIQTNHNLSDPNLAFPVTSVCEELWQACWLEMSMPFDYRLTEMLNTI